MISTLSSICPIFAVVAFFSWLGGELDFLKRTLYLRTGIWRALRWGGTFLFLFGFFAINLLDTQSTNLPMLCGSIAMLLGSARTTHRPKNQKPIFQLGNISVDESADSESTSHSDK